MTETNPEAAAPTERQMFRLSDVRVSPQSGRGGGCGCGGKGHAQRAAQVSPAQGAADPRLTEAAPAPVRAGGGCGCGGHGHRSGHGGHGGAGGEELVATSIPKAVRHAVLAAAMDALPVGENLVLAAPHQPDHVFEHLQNSEAHYRVETLQAGPESWRYRITRLS